MKKKLIREKNQIQTLEQYLNGWKEAMATIFDEDTMKVFLELKAKQFDNK